MAMNLNIIVRVLILLLQELSLYYSSDFSIQWDKLIEFPESPSQLSRRRLNPYSLHRLITPLAAGPLLPAFSTRVLPLQGLVPELETDL